MAKATKRSRPRGGSRKSNTRTNKRTRSGKASSTVVGKRRRVSGKHAKLDVSIHETPRIEQRGVSKMEIHHAKRRAIL